MVGAVGKQKSGGYEEMAQTVSSIHPLTRLIREFTPISKVLCEQSSSLHARWVVRTKNYLGNFHLRIPRPRRQDQQVDPARWNIQEG
jgi:hypothetical protein